MLFHPTSTMLTALALSVSVGGAALAQNTCSQDNAVYLEERSGARLTFKPNEAGAATYYLMELELSSGQVFGGSIVWGSGFSVPGGSFDLRDCRPTTASECRSWNALVYQLRDDGVMDYIGAGKPASQVLLPELTAYLYFFDRARRDEPGWDITRSDTFFFLRCG